MAVPTGTWTALASIDLSPLFTRIEQRSNVGITQPEADALDRQIEALASPDAAARRAAARQLQYFPDDGERIVQAVLALLADPEQDVQSMVVSVLMRHERHTGKHAAELLPLLANQDLDDRTRLAVAWLVARHAPVTGEVEAALRAAVEFVAEEKRMGLRAALDLFRRRK